MHSSEAPGGRMNSFGSIRIVASIVFLAIVPSRMMGAAQRVAAPSGAAAAMQAPDPAKTPVPAQATVPAPGMASQLPPPPEGQALHILVGKSVVVNVQTPITRVLSSNPAVIETLATSPTEVVVEGRAAGSSSLILWDQSGRSQMLDVIVDVDVSGLRSAIERSYPDQHIDVQADGGRLILTGKVTDAKTVEDLTKMSTVYSN